MKKRGRHLRQALTEKIVKSVERAGRYADGGCLYLVVQPSGSRSWIVRTTVRGKRRDLGLGGVDTVSLEKARKRAAEILTSVKEEAYNRRTHNKDGQYESHY